MFARGFALVGIPVTKEPVGLFRMDGKRLNGLTLVPWQSDKSFFMLRREKWLSFDWIIRERSSSRGSSSGRGWVAL